MGSLCSSDKLLSCIGVTLPKEVYIQNHRLGFFLLVLRVAALAFCLNIILNAPTKGWLRNELPIGSVVAWAESGNYTDQSIADLGAPFCDEALNEKFDYWYDASWSYTNASCRSLPAGERSMKHAGEIYVPTYFSETFAETRAANKTGIKGDCRSACRSEGACPNLVEGHVGSRVFQPTGSFNAFGDCLCTCETSQNVFAVGASAIQVALETSAKVREDPNLNKFKRYISTRGDEVLTVIRSIQGDIAVEFARFKPGETVKLSVADWMKLGSVHSLNGVNDETRENYKADTKYEKFPLLRITGAEVMISINYHNKLDPAHSTPDWAGPVCYIEVSVLKVWSSKPIMAWGAVEDVRGAGSYRYRYYYGISFKYESKGHFSFWNPIGVFTILASVVVYLNMPNFLMVYLTRYCLGTLSSIYYKAQTEILETGNLFYGLLCRALIGKACYEMLLSRQKQEQHSHGNMSPSTGLTEASLDVHLKELFEDEERLDQHELATIRSVLSEGLDVGTEGIVSRKAFVEGCTSSEECTLRELVDLFDNETFANPCMNLFDGNKEKRRKLAVHKSISQQSIQSAGANLKNVSGEIHPPPHSISHLTAHPSLRRPTEDDARSPMVMDARSPVATDIESPVTLQFSN